MLRFGSAPEDPQLLVSAATLPSNDFQIIRRTIVFAQSELLTLAQEPVTDPLCHGDGNEPIELDRFYYDSLEPGRWLIISGERQRRARDERSKGERVADAGGRRANRQKNGSRGR